MKSKLTPEIAEIVGIMMGDGGLYLDRLKKYQTSVSFHKEEKQYLYYVKELLENNFKYKFCITELESEYLLRNTSVFVGKTLISYGLSSGNKVKNNVIIPTWVLTKNKFITSFVRGFFDTDGCVYRKYANYLQIQIKLGSKITLESIRNAIIKLGFNPTVIQRDEYNNKISWKFYLSRQNEIKLFFNKIKPANIKHVKRFNKIRK